MMYILHVDWYFFFSHNVTVLLCQILYSLWHWYPLVGKLVDALVGVFGWNLGELQGFLSL